jgi:hypothetical protein
MRCENASPLRLKFKLIGILRLRLTIRAFARKSAFAQDDNA